MLEPNDAARLLYEKLGFQRVRDLEVWTLDAETPAAAGREVPVEEAHAFVRTHRPAEEPWQRGDGTLERLDGLQAVAVDGGAAVYRASDGRVFLLQAAAFDDDAATALVAALRAQGEVLVVLNLPPDEPCARASRASAGVSASASSR